jgi:hypothetical protein
MSRSPSRSTVLISLAVAAIGVWAAGCGSHHNGNTDDGGPLDANHNMGITVTPDPANLDLTAGGPAVTQTFIATAHLPGGDQDVSASATWSIDDAGMGAMNGATFTSVTDRGGSTLVHAVYMDGGTTYAGAATLNVTLHDDTSSTTCPGCPAFPPSGTACPATGDPTLVYPPDGVLLPPNMNVIAVQFLPGTGNTLFEIDFSNSTTDIRIETRCNDVTSTRGDATGGCTFTLDPSTWGFLANSNRGADPVKVTVRGAPEDLSCIGGSNSRQISFATEDLAGGIYYWQSITMNGVAGASGGIFRKDFGDPSPMGEPFLTPADGSNKCVGCHFVSRDGAVLTVGSDDADSDDEYGDMKVSLYDIASHTVLANKLPAGFQTFQGAGHDSFLASDGVGKSAMPILDRFDGMTGTAGTNVTFTGTTALDGKRISQPDWSRDGTRVYFTVPGTIITGLTGYNRTDDSHFTNGAIWSMTYDAGTDTFSDPQPLVTPADADENDYYPAISPDGTSLIFDRAVGTALDTHDGYNNPNATLYGLALSGGAPVELAKANDKPGLTNSWPRFSPFVQLYKGKHILWVTFSSTRDYGVRVQNEDPPSGATVNCYPPVSPEDPSGDHTKPFAANCTQPQIWMAAITLEDLAAGTDPSYPAFWLPFQDDTAHNHIAQWVETVVGPPSCQGNTCSSGSPCCNGYTCDPTTMTCQVIVP